MKQKPITLRKFVENFPLTSFQEVICRQLPLNFNELSYREKYSYAGQGDKLFKLSVKNDAIYATVNFLKVNRVGCRIFKKSETSSSVYIEPNKITVRGDAEAVMLLLKHLNLNWFRDIPAYIESFYFIKPTILRALLTKRIYSEETLYKRIGTSCFQLKDVSWKSVREYCTNSNFYEFSIYDLRDFTKNVEQSIQVIAKHRFTSIHLYRDLLTYACEYNQIVDFTWSEKRINEEHQKQILAKRNGELSKKDETPIYTRTIGNDNIKLLNTEKDIFLESEMMCHCLYRCYYSRIRNKEYIAFHMRYPEDCTFSVRPGMHNNIIFDQIYLKYDRMVQDSTKEIAQKFIDCNKDNILRMFKEPINTKTSLLEQQMNMFDEDMPF